MRMKELLLRGSLRESHIYIEKGALARSAEFLPKDRQEGKVCIITDSNVAPLYLNSVIKSFEEHGFHGVSHVVPAGEEFKTLGTMARIYDTLAENGLGRGDTLAALGGGVIGDMAGFAAATYMRGMKNLVQIPTTLLAQVDSSVGGKCGVDLTHGKNLVGAFRQPDQVIIDTDALLTLPEEVFCAGMAEVIKYGCIWDNSILEEVCEPNFRENPEEIIAKCIAIKIKVVEEDETEMGVRKLLNFGHTIGHGVEKLGNYVDLSHGQGVAVGMTAALKLGEGLGITKKGTADYVRSILERFNLPTSISYPLSDVFAAMMSDKKKQGKQISFIYITELGRAEIVKTQVAELEKQMKLLSED